MQLPVFFFTNYLNTYFIDAYLTKNELTVFNTIFQITGLLTQLPILLNMLLMPQFVSMKMDNKNDSIKKYMEDVLPFMTIIWGFGIGLASFTLTWFIPAFFGAEFSGEAMVIILLSAGAIFTFPSLVGYSPFIMSVSEVKISFPMALVMAVVNVAAHFVLIKPFGLTGSAIATLLSVISGLLYISVYVGRKYSFRTNHLFLSLLPSILSITVYLIFPNIYIFMSSLAILSFLFVVSARSKILPYINLAFKMLKSDKE
jgi:O-antigen/teichoic acid export membrane protein